MPGLCKSERQGEDGTAPRSAAAVGAVGVEQGMPDSSGAVSAGLVLSLCDGQVCRARGMFSCTRFVDADIREFVIPQRVVTGVGTEGLGSSGAVLDGLFFPSSLVYLILLLVLSLMNLKPVLLHLRRRKRSFQHLKQQLGKKKRWRL